MNVFSPGVRRWIAALALFITLPAIGRAQTDQGRFTGMVRDSSGAPAVGVAVTLKNVDEFTRATHSRYRLETSAS